MRRRTVWLLLVSGSLLLLLLNGWLSPRASASPSNNGFSYNCTMVQPFNACYGQVIYGGFPTLKGMATDLQPVPLLTYDSGGAIFNTMWLLDGGEGSACQALPPAVSACWIEAGYVYKTALASKGTHLYWADVRPQWGGCGTVLSCGYAEHTGPTLQLADFQPANRLHQQIQYVGVTAKGPTWSINQSVTGGVTRWFNNYSTHNAMAPEEVNFGEELHGAGTTGKTANAPKALYDKNMYEYQPISMAGLPLPPVWAYLSSSGTPDGPPNNPPWSGWNLGRTPQSYGSGGEWYVCIQTPSSPSSNPC